VAHDADIANIVLSETNLKTTVSVTVKKDKLTGDGITTIGGIAADSALKSFTAKTASLNDSGFVSTAAVKTLAFRASAFRANRDRRRGHRQTGIETSARWRSVHRSPRRKRSPLSMPTSIEPSTIMADAIGTINVKAGVLAASIASAGAIGKFTVKGGGFSGDLTAARFGAVSITGGDFSGSLTALTLPATLGRPRRWPRSR
jgi:hypothetical protein